MPLALLLFVSLVNDVRALVAHHELAAAEAAVQTYRRQAGATPELAAAVSWIARGALEAGQLDTADRFAGEARQLSLGLLRGRPLDSDAWLPTALGAAIEVHAQVLAARGDRGAAVAYLDQQLLSFGKASIGERIRKNVNLLSLVGKPAPPLEEKQWFGPKPPSLAALHGHPVLLFFWAHWCPDCKAEAPILASLLRIYGPQGLVLIGPTRLYGYTGGGEEATAEAERRYIDQVRRKFYSALASMPAPLSAANFLAYGASTTPTLVLIDRAGAVSWYHPGAASEAELSARIQGLLGAR